MVDSKPASDKAILALEASSLDSVNVGDILRDMDAAALMADRLDSQVDGLNAKIDALLAELAQSP